MLKAQYEPQLTPADEAVFVQLSLATHDLRRLEAVIDFAPCRALVADCYFSNHGSTALDPVQSLKLLILCFQARSTCCRPSSIANVSSAFLGLL